MVLGKHGINIKFMQVASLDPEATKGADTPPDPKGNEALMILGVLGPVSSQVLDDLQSSEGVLDVSLVKL